MGLMLQQHGAMFAAKFQRLRFGGDVFGTLAATCMMSCKPTRRTA
jgi:hypothetical protein